MKITKELAKFNHIKFHDEEHKYYMDGKRTDSVTSVIGKYKHPFDKDFWSKKKADERGITKEEILTEWKYKADFSCERGSAFHEFAENYLANKVFPFPEYKITNALGGEDNMLECKEGVYKLIDMFKKFYDDSHGKLVPVRAEVVVGDGEWGITGMIDQLFFNEKSGKLEIWDWKTNKAIKKENKWQQFKKPLSHLDVCELNTYSLQLSFYRLIVERNTELELGDSYIVWFNENNDTYKVMKCFDFRNEILKIMG
jgi:ATP-dependent exoDNAse (exonuclease V) beta subunit|tara:strand:- start:34 stop:798 length:765 start_codon:yes stop_codon:yes gene_type:complete